MVAHAWRLREWGVLTFKHFSAKVRTKNGSSLAQNLALTVLFVRRSLDGDLEFNMVQMKQVDVQTSVE